MKSIIVTVLSICMLGARSAQGSTNEVLSKTEVDAGQKILSMYLNMPDKCIRLGEKVPLVLTVVNHGNEPLYIHHFADFYVMVNTTQEEAVMFELEDEFNIPHINEFVDVSGELVYMRKVVEVQQKSGIVFLCPDFVKPYTNWLKPGHYFMHLPRALRVYSKSQVIIREDWDHPFFVPDNEKPEMEVSPDIVTFEVIE